MVVCEATTIHNGAEYDSYNARLFGKFEGKLKDVDDTFSWEDFVLSKPISKSANKNIRQTFSV